MGVLLSTPILKKESQDGIGPAVSFGSSAMQGWRTKMEDAQRSELEIAPQLSFFGVFDGHGGNEVSLFVARHIVDNIKSSKHFLAKDYDKCLIDAYLSLDVMLDSEEGNRELGGNMRVGSQTKLADGIGCTAVSCIYDDSNSRLFVANAGDSRIILCRAGKAIPLSTDHKPSLESELRRIEKAGGYVANGRVNRNLNLCRAIGDLEYKKNKSLSPAQQIITAYPETRVVNIDSECEFVVLGCDGVWDVLSNDDCIELVRKQLLELPLDAPLSQICEGIVNKCCAKEPSEVVGCDNVSFTLVVFNKNVKRATMEMRVQTEIETEKETTMDVE